MIARYVQPGSFREHMFPSTGDECKASKSTTDQGNGWCKAAKEKDPLQQFRGLGAVYCCALTWAIYKRHMPHKLHVSVFKARNITRRVVFFTAPIRFVTPWPVPIMHNISSLGALPYTILQDSTPCFLLEKER